MSHTACRLAIAGTATVLLFAASARAQTPTQYTPYGAPVGGAANIDPTYTAVDALARRYKYKAVTVYCYRKNALGQKLFQINVRWHWSWWVNSAGQPTTIKNAWHESSYPSNMAYWWSLEDTWQASMAKEPTMWFQTIYAHFQMSVGPVTLNRTLLIWPFLWAGGGSTIHCTEQ